MKTDVYRFERAVSDIDSITALAEKAASYCGLDEDQELKLMLLCEELIEILRHHIIVGLRPLYRGYRAGLLVSTGLQLLRIALKVFQHRLAVFDWMMRPVLRRPGVVLADALLALLLPYDARRLLTCFALQRIPRILTAIGDFVTVILRAANHKNGCGDDT